MMQGREGVMKRYGRCDAREGRCHEKVGKV